MGVPRVPCGICFNPLERTSPLANSIPRLVPDDGSSAVDPLLRVALIHSRRMVRLCLMASQAVLKNLLSTRAAAKEEAGWHPGAGRDREKVLSPPVGKLWGD